MNKAQEVKVVLLGEAAVGKSSIILRFVTNTFSEAYGVTIGGAFMAKLLIHNGVSTKFKIWDTAGEERFRSLASMYYKDAQVALLVYDITKKDSLQSLTYYIEELQKNGPPNITLVVVGNKTDLIEQEQVSIEVGSAFAKEHGAMFKLTSAKEGRGIQDLFEKIAEEIEKKNSGSPTNKPGGSKLGTGPNPNQKSGCC